MMKFAFEECGLGNLQIDLKSQRNYIQNDSKWSPFISVGCQNFLYYVVFGKKDHKEIFL